VKLQEGEYNMQACPVLVSLLLQKCAWHDFTAGLGMCQHVRSCGGLLCVWVAALASRRFGSRHFHGGNHIVFPIESPIGINIEGKSPLQHLALQ
jgi:hypothetical protein